MNGTVQLLQLHDARYRIAETVLDGRRQGLDSIRLHLYVNNAQICYRFHQRHYGRLLPLKLSFSAFGLEVNPFAWKSIG